MMQLSGKKMQVKGQTVDLWPAACYDADRGGMSKLKITVERADEVELILRCPDDTAPEIQQLLLLLGGSPKIPVQQNSKTVLLPFAKLLYAETVDDRLYLYTAAEIFVCKMTLTTLCERYEESGLFRCSKSMAVSLSEICSLKSERCGRILIELPNKEKIIVSRSYAAKLRRRLSL